MDVGVAFGQCHLEFCAGHIHRHTRRLATRNRPRYRAFDGHDIFLFDPLSLAGADGVYFLGYTLGWFPFSDGYDVSLTPGWNLDFLLSAGYHAILPALTLIISTVAGWMLTMRNSMITTLSEDYVLLAQAKGLRSRRVMFAYAARNAILPSVTGFAIALGTVVGGALLVEIVFSYPGIGYALFQAIQGQDYALADGILLLIIVATVLMNLVVDVLYTVLDPRVRQERSV